MERGPPHSYHNVSCTLLPREPETMRERECRWKHSPRMLSCSLGCSCRLLSSRFFSGLWCPSQRVSCLTDCHLLSRAKTKYTLRHILVFIFDRFTNARTLFSLSYIHPCFALAPRGLRAEGKSVESRTRTVSSHVTLTWESRRTHLARVYSRH